MQDGAEPDHATGGGHHRRQDAPAVQSGRRLNANYRYFGTILFLGALAMILLMVLLHR